MSNRLAEESSPYLRQHADNPVDWYPWGVDALERAQTEDKPILLSIGYAACHWCHVMAHESFEDQATPAYMNDHFINVKVDREERPDIDAIYMEAAQAMSGHGGWPLTAFLTPDQAPFYAGTYFPPTPRPGMPSFLQVMESVIDAWTNRRDQIEASREKMVEALSATARLKAPEDPVNADQLEDAVVGVIASYEPVHGGFSGAPKFPPHSLIDFLLAEPDSRCREFAHETLKQMAEGGIYDQIGGGFARYSTDARWHVPHFEKMLYDNALLARNYLHAWQQTGDELFGRVCRETLDWMLTEMRGDEGGFASALDADSLDSSGHSEEGAFYAWDKDELVEVAQLAAPDAVDDLLAYWGVIDDGEFEGKNVLFVNAPERRPAESDFAAIRKQLYDHRAKRSWPARDDKRVTAWNALAIAAFAEAGAVLGEPHYLDAARACAEFIEAELRTANGRLRRSWLDARVGPAGYLDDHAYVVAAYLTLYEATFDERWFTLARGTADTTIAHFADTGGGFFTTADDHEELLVRRKDLDDSPLPSGNAAAALALLRLAAFTGDQRYREIATSTLQILQTVAVRYPTGFGHTLQGMAFHLSAVTEVALVGDELSDFTSLLRGEYQPHRVVAAVSQSANGRSSIELLAGRTAIDGRPTAYVCESFTCRLPVHEAEELAAQLAEVRFAD